MTNHTALPQQKPKRPHFSSGPCAKRPGWSLEAFRTATLGRSHRAKISKSKLHKIIEKSRNILNIPDDYRVGIVPASDTGAIEMALWNLLGARGVDVFAWESFGDAWAKDCKDQLKLKDIRIFQAEYGQLPDLTQADFNRDVVFTWNGTTSGVRVPNGDWIADDREGLTICDATSAVFAQDVPFEKLDVVTWSWQKALGGEGAHGMIALSPRAVSRLESYTPSWPMPKIFQLTKKGALISGIFEGETINTPSMLCVEDALDGLNWAESIGGLEGLIARANANTKALADWVLKTPWVAFLADDETVRSNTSVCLKITDETYLSLPNEQQESIPKIMAKLLEDQQVAFDIGAYRDAPSGLRIWCGATVNVDDVTLLTHWLDWAFHKAMGEMK